MIPHKFEGKGFANLVDFLSREIAKGTRKADVSIKTENCRAFRLFLLLAAPHVVIDKRLDCPDQTTMLTIKPFDWERN